MYSPQKKYRQTTKGQRSTAKTKWKSRGVKGDLDKLYDDLLNEFVETQQIEYIERLYNLDFEMIGYKRYKA